MISPLIFGYNLFLSSEGDYVIIVIKVMKNITSNSFGRDLLEDSNDFTISILPVFKVHVRVMRLLSTSIFAAFRRLLLLELPHNTHNPCSSTARSTLLAPPHW